MISAKPIPTLMTSSNSNLYQNSTNSRYHSNYSAPIFKYPSTSPNERIFRPPLSHPSASLPLPPPPPIQYHQHQHQYPSNYVVSSSSSYYPQQQAPLFYQSQHDPLNINNKRYGEPPAPPMKRFRYDINTYQHY